MTSYSPQVEFDESLSVPASLVEQERYCGRCKDCWPLTSEFWGKNSRMPDGFMNVCKACQRDRERKIVCMLEPDVHSKACTTCNEIKPVNSASFMPVTKCADGFSSQCLECQNKAITSRTCQHCDASLSLTSEFFAKNPKMPDGFALICKTCHCHRHSQAVGSAKPHAYLKACSTCAAVKPVNRTFFMPMNKCKDGFSTQCRECKNQKVRERKALIKAGKGLAEVFVPTHNMKYQVCNACKIEKPRDPAFWHRSSGARDGMLNQCKDCTNEVSKLRRVYPGMRIAIVKPEDVASNKPRTPPPKRRHTKVSSAKSCNACRVIKPLTTEFWYKSNSPSHSDGWVTRCKVCESNAQKEARRKRREAKELQESAA